MGKSKYKTREEWLIAAINELRKYFLSNGFVVPENIKVSCSWAFDRNREIDGETWDSTASKSNHYEIFITPKYDSTDVCKKHGILSTLIHELIHVVVGLKCNHKGAFKQTYKKLGLTGKVSESLATKELCSVFKNIETSLGIFPHRALQLKDKVGKKQTTRLLKLQCPECDYVIRVTRIHLDEKGAPLCPIHKKSFIEV